MIIKRTCKIVDFAIPDDHNVKLKESKKKNTTTLLGNYKNCETESDVYTNYNWCAWYSHQRIIKGTEGLGNKRTSGDHPNYSITEIGQDTEKSPGDLRKLTVTHTPVKDHQLTLRCPWCNGYRLREWTRQHEFKSWMRLIAFHIVLIPWGKV